MNKCNCLVSKYSFVVMKNYKWTPVMMRYPYEIKLITIHGESLDEIESKRDDIKKQLEKKYGEQYKVWVNIE